MGRDEGAPSSCLRLWAAKHGQAWEAFVKKSASRYQTTVHHGVRWRKMDISS